MDEQNRNLILAVVLSGLVMVVWLTFFSPPVPQTPVAPVTEAGSVVTPEGEAAPEAPTLSPALEALKTAARIEIDTPKLKGSLSTLGGRIDELYLKDYHVSLDPSSDLVQLLGPEGSDVTYYAVHGWAPAGGLDAALVPGPTTPFTQEGTGKLTEQTPVTLKWDNANGLIFRVKISVDANYLFSVEQSVENTTSADVRMFAYGIVARRSVPSTSLGSVRHEGVVRQSDNELEEIDYPDMPDLDPVAAEGANASLIEVTEKGWVGFTDSYWMTTLAPLAGQPFTSVAKYVARDGLYQVETRLPTTTVAAGASFSTTSRLFAGAKEYDAIKTYERDQGIYRFIDSIDWGWFFYLTKPMFAVLHWLNNVLGNMGWAIIGLTIIIKTLVFPLSYKSYVSMARMKELQPEMEALKERVGNDRQKMQVEMLALYKKNKVNPAAGCLPILIQIPIFFSLYKVISVTIELYHAPWLGWIRDLSSPDPSSILNLFGLLPWATPEVGTLLHFISLGVLPILLGVSMWFQQKLNPAPTDATQAAIFAWMPWIFMFMLGSFASGLVLYWIANNTLTFIQQYSIMAIHGKRPDLFGNIRQGFAKKPAPDKK
jgi:YidC/Oxa1 family membrane protein insertase